MTRSTVIKYTCVIKNRRGKRYVSVANMAILNGWQVTCPFNHIRISGEELRFMTTFATTANTRVNIAHKDRRGKTADVGIDVALTAFGLGRDMIHLFTHSDNLVMAGSAIVRIDPHVIKGRPGKIDIITHDVTHRAIAVSRHVIHTLACRGITVMARPAITRIDAYVIKRRALKSIGTRMTISTILVIWISRDVIDMFARTDRTVVTSRARNGGIIDTQIMIKHASGKITRGVADIAIQISRHVIE